MEAADKIMNTVTTALLWTGGTLFAVLLAIVVYSFLSALLGMRR